MRGLGETYAQTPVYAQLTAARPAASHFLHTRATAAAVATPLRDPCNFPERCKPGSAHATLWPTLQSKGAAEHCPAAVQVCACQGVSRKQRAALLLY